MTEYLDRTYAKDIIALLSVRPRRFKDLMQSLSGISSRTLTDRLDEGRGREVNLIKKVWNDSTETVEYVLTEHGQKAFIQIQNLKQILLVAATKA